MDYISMKNYFDRYNHQKSIKEAECGVSWNTEQKKKDRNKNKEGKSKPSPKKGCFVNKTNRKSQKKVTPTIHILIRTHQYGVKQVVVRKKILECVRVGEKLFW